jgi:hypothetical protein
MNLLRLRGSRKQPIPGDLFVFHLRGGGFGFGCVIRDNAVVGPWRDLYLVYIFDHFSESKDLPNNLVFSSLLIPPIFSNQKPWKEGFFEHAGHCSLASEDLPEAHCFRDLRGFYYDEFGNRCGCDGGVCAEYRLESYWTIDDLISEKTGLPLSEDDS